MKRKLLTMEEWKKSYREEARAKAREEVKAECRVEGEKALANQILQMIDSGCTIADIKAYLEDVIRKAEVALAAMARRDSRPQ